MKTKRFVAFLTALCFLVLSFTAVSCKPAEKGAESSNKGDNNPPDSVILATTTSTQDSGLLDYLLPIFEKDYGLKVKVIAVGSGQALALGQKGDADVLLVHSPADEEEFMEGGYGVNRLAVMHNQFILVGPSSDPAQVAGARDITEAMKRISESQAPFVSRGDQSGTHKKELGLWKAAGITPGGSWYVEAGQGMGETLSMASQKKAYTLSDEATFLSMKGKIDLTALREGDKQLFNPYHVIEVNPDKFPGVNNKGAHSFAEFLTSQKGQDLIAQFGKDQYGKSLFVPDAGKE